MDKFQVEGSCMENLGREEMIRLRGGWEELSLATSVTYSIFLNAILVRTRRRGLSWYECEKEDDFDTKTLTVHYGIKILCIQNCTERLVNESFSRLVPILCSIRMKNFF